MKLIDYQISRAVLGTGNNPFAPVFLASLRYSEDRGNEDNDRKMLKRNYPIEEICEITGLSAEKIAQLQAAEQNADTEQ